MGENKERLEESVIEVDDDVFGLFRGVPGPDTLAECRNLMQTATELRLKEEPADNLLFQYGPEDGDPLYLDELAKFLSEEYNSPVDKNDLVTTAGATNGLLHLLSLIFPHKCYVFVEEVSYFLAVSAMEKELGYNLIPIPLENDGLDLNCFEKTILEYQSKNSYPIPEHGFWSVLYTIPEFHNPSGRTLSNEKSEKLVKLAQKYNVLVICEDVYNLLTYEKSCSPRLFALDDRKNKPGCVISNGSFTKYTAPGLRLGWIEVPPWLKNLWMASSLLCSGGCLNMYTSGVIGTAMKYGLVSSLLQKLRTKYKNRMKVLCDTFERHLPKSCHFIRPMGGYFVWIEMPPNYDSTHLGRLAFERYKIKFQDGWKFAPSSSANKFRNCFRLSISYYDEKVLEDCAIKLCLLLNELCI